MSEELQAHLTRWLTVQDTLGTPTPSSPTVPAMLLPLPSRYTLLEPLGAGGMGLVWKVFDRTLEREVALKVSHPNTPAAAVAAFLAEAQRTAALQHPAIVPIHDLGRLDDERLFFTMKIVRGDTFAAHLRRDEPLRRTVAALLTACEAVAYAHAHQIVHCDLKPTNIMIGEFGDVMVLDWGISRLSGERSRGWGTPAYMPPEQARSEVLSPSGDVYALGAILYEVLTGRPPHTGPSGEAILQSLLNSTPPPPRGPVGLAAVCSRAIAPLSANRYPDAGALAAAIRAWLEDTRRRQQALALVEQAAEVLPRAGALQQRATALRQAAEQSLAEVPRTAPATARSAAWAMQDEADALEKQAATQRAEAEGTLRAALSVEPLLPEAHRLLAEQQQRALRSAEDRRDPVAAARAETFLRGHLRQLPLADPVGSRLSAWLDGTGALTLLTDPPGASATLHAITEQGRILQPGPGTALGATPLHRVPLSPGSYLVTLDAPGFATTRYPIQIGRQEHWDGVPPGQRASLPIPLLRPDQVGEGACYVPAGWCQLGAGQTVRTWVDGFLLQTLPVTNGAWLSFLDGLVTEGRSEDALRHQPRSPGSAGAPLWRRDAAGRFHLQPDGEGDPWPPDWAIALVDWDAARAFARHRGGGWRLPSEWEWEKAARGVDGRVYPWGDHWDPSFCCNRDGQGDYPFPSPSHAHPTDTSVYGVRHLAGNFGDWCRDPWRPALGLCDGQRAPAPLPTESDRMLMIRGGAWGGQIESCRAGNRQPVHRINRSTLTSVRLLRPWP